MRTRSLMAAASETYRAGMLAVADRRVYRLVRTRLTEAAVH